MKRDGVLLVSVGYMPGSCFSTELIRTRDYIIIAEVSETSDAGGHRLQVRPVDTEIAATPQNIVEVTRACRLRPKYPAG